MTTYNTCLFRRAVTTIMRQNGRNETIKEEKKRNKIMILSTCFVVRVPLLQPRACTCPQWYCVYSHYPSTTTAIMHGPLERFASAGPQYCSHSCFRIVMINFLDGFWAFRQCRTTSTRQVARRDNGTSSNVAWAHQFLTSHTYAYFKMDNRKKKECNHNERGTGSTNGMEVEWEWIAAGRRTAPKWMYRMSNCEQWSAIGDERNTCSFSFRNLLYKSANIIMVICAPGTAQCLCRGRLDVCAKRTYPGIMPPTMQQSYRF